MGPQPSLGVAQPITETHEANARVWDITPRQHAVLACLVATGGSDKSIAIELGCKPKTVRHHLDELLAKLGVSSRTGLALRALQLELCPLPLLEAPPV